MIQRFYPCEVWHFLLCFFEHLNKINGESGLWFQVIHSLLLKKHVLGATFAATEGFLTSEMRIRSIIRFSKTRLLDCVSINS